MIVYVRLLTTTIVTYFTVVLSREVGHCTVIICYWAKSLYQFSDIYICLKTNMGTEIQNTNASMSHSAAAIRLGIV
jgi:hypothetical protein